MIPPASAMVYMKHLCLVQKTKPSTLAPVRSNKAMNGEVYDIPTLDELPENGRIDSLSRRVPTKR